MLSNFSETNNSKSLRQMDNVRREVRVVDRRFDMVALVDNDVCQPVVARPKIRVEVIIVA